MIRLFIRYLKGYVKIRITGYSPERFLNLCSFHQIYIWGLKPVGNGYEMYLSVADFRKLKPLVKKSHVRAVLCDRAGFPFFLACYRKRKLFFAGILFCIILLKVYSLFIWDIHFEGNRRWPDETLAEFLASGGVKAGMAKSSVDCPGIVKDIRKAYNDIVWVSASIDGSRLKIQIKENEDTFREEETDVSAEETPTDLIASKDGVITEIVTRSGVPQVHVGDQVKKGDILVLGRVDVINDSQEVIGYQYQQSDADVFADTQLTYSDTMPLSWQKKVYDGKKKAQLFLNLAGWKISVGSIRSSYEHSEISVQETPLKLGENFYLPVSFGKKTARSYSFEETAYTEEEIQEKLSLNFQRFCEDLEEKGIQIRKNDVKIHVDETSAAASGTLWLNERITEEADTEILTIERKETDESVGTDH